jgi:hypothetical protein
LLKPPEDQIYRVLVVVGSSYSIVLGCQGFRASVVEGSRLGVIGVIKTTNLDGLKSIELPVVKE